MSSLFVRAVLCATVGVFSLLVLAPPSLAQALINPSFETPVYTVDNWYQNPSGAGVAWSFTGVSGIRYFANPDGSNGRQAAYLAGEGTTASLGRMSQTVSLPAGTYQIRFLAARGAGSDNGGTGAEQPIHFQVGSSLATLSDVGAIMHPRWYGPTNVQPTSRVAPSYPEGAFETWWTQPFAVAGGSTVVSFAATEPSALESQDAVTYLDQMVIVQVSAQFQNGSFETVNANGTTPTGWTVGGNAQAVGSGADGRDGARAALITYFQYGGTLTQNVTVPAGKYSVSARLRKDADGVACGVSVLRVVGGTGTGLATLPPPASTQFMSATSGSFDLTAGTHQIQLSSAPCGATQRVVEIDAVTLNRAGPSFGNVSFETPDARVTTAPGYVAPSGERGAYRDNPQGATWTFQTGSGVMRNPSPPGGGSVIYYTPSTNQGSQYAYLKGSNKGFEQAVTLSPGWYVLVLPATTINATNLDSSGSLTVKVNNTTISTMPGFHNWDLSMSERMSAPFEVTAAMALSNVTVRVQGTSMLVDAPRIVQVITNPPPDVKLAITNLPAPAINAVGYNVFTVASAAATWPLISLSATATDLDGIVAPGVTVVTINNDGAGASTSLGSGASPFTANPWANVAPGKYLVRATATDTKGATGIGEMKVKVNVAPSAGLTLVPAGLVHVDATAMQAYALTINASDSDGTVTAVEVLVDDVLKTTCTFSAGSWSCPLLLAPRNASYAIAIRVTDDDGAKTTTAPTTVTVNGRPTVSVATNPAGQATVSVGTPVSLVAAADDPSDAGSVTKVEMFWALASNPSARTSLGAKTSAPWTWSWIPASTVSYIITADATDNRGGIKTSTDVNIAACGAPGVTLQLSSIAVGSGQQQPPLTSFTSGEGLINLGSETQLHDVRLGAALSFPAACGSVQSVVFEKFNTTTSAWESLVPPNPTNGSALPAPNALTYVYTWSGRAAGRTQVRARANVVSASSQLFTGEQLGTLILNRPPTVSAISLVPAGSSFAAPLTSVDVKVSAYDLDTAPTEAINTVSVTLDGGAPLATTLAAGTYNVTLNTGALGVGAHTITGTARDNRGHPSAPLTKSIRICATPTMSWVSANPANIVVNRSQTLTARVTRSDVSCGTPTVAFQVNGGPLNCTSTSNGNSAVSAITDHSCTWTPSATTASPLSITATASVPLPNATQAASTLPYSVSVVVNAAPSFSNPPVSISANPTQFSPVTFTANVTDPNGDQIRNVTFTVFNAGGQVVVTLGPLSPGVLSANWTPPNFGNNYSVRATATDVDGLAATPNPSLAVPFNILQANTAPSVSAFSASSATTTLLGDSVAFNYTVSDPDASPSLTVRLVRVSDGAVLASNGPTIGSPQSGTITWSSATPVGATVVRLEVFDGIATALSSNTITITVTSELLTFIHSSVSGSPIMATNSAGAMVWNEDYSAFGERVKNQSGANSGAAANQNWFIGKPVDSATGLVYFGARWYDPQVGRFLGFDPAGVDEDNPHSFNRYAYGNNNPNKYLDPDGRQAVQVAIGLGGLYLASSVMAPPAGKGDGVLAGGAPPPQASGTHVSPASPPQLTLPEGFQAAVTSGLLAIFRLMHPELDAASHILTSTRFPDRPLPRDANGNPVGEPNAAGAHSQLGQKDGRKGKYDQAREFDAKGKPVRDIDFTDHGRPKTHPNPHQHQYVPNTTGGTPSRGPTEPLQ